MKCPFCEPSAADIVLLETPFARVVCDALPITTGHVLITTKAHTPSMLDLSEAERQHIRVIQHEVGRRLSDAFGAAGHYEHGRSTLCRFHVADPRHVHAHVHSLPIAFDLVAASRCARTWDTLPQRLLEVGQRYIYQDMLGSGERWGAGGLPEVRHFVRTYLQNALNDRGVRVIPVDADPAEHDLAIDETAVRFRAAKTAADLVVAVTEDAGALAGTLAHTLADAGGFLLSSDDADPPRPGVPKREQSLPGNGPLIRISSGRSDGYQHLDLKITFGTDGAARRGTKLLTLNAEQLTPEDLVTLIRTAAEIRAM